MSINTYTSPKEFRLDGKEYEYNFEIGTRCDHCSSPSIFLFGDPCNNINWLYIGCKNCRTHLRTVCIAHLVIDNQLRLEIEETLKHWSMFKITKVEAAKDNKNNYILTTYDEFMWFDRNKAAGDE